MSGESALAQRLAQDAIETANKDGNSTSEAVLFALLSEVLSRLLETRSRADLEHFIEYHLDNYDETEWVITRGC